MPPKTEQELALQRTYELARKKKEEKLRAKQAKLAAQSAGGVASPAVSTPSDASRPSAAAAAPARAAAPPRAQTGTSAVEKIAGESPMDYAKRTISVLPQQPCTVAAAGGEQAADGGKKAPVVKLNPWPTAKLPDGGAAARRPAAVAADTGRTQVPPAQQSGGARPDSSTQPAQPRRPGIKRPTAQRVAPPAPQQQQQGSKRAREEPDDDFDDDGAGDYEARQQSATLFVGDLPPDASSDDLAALFGSLAPVAEAKVMAGQRYGFVTFMDPQIAADVHAECYRQPVDIGGRVLRVHRARGEMPKWQQGPTHAAPQGGLGAGRSLTMPFEEHPKVREARMAAHADAEAVDKDELLALSLQHPPDRELVVYDDI